ncbi:MAG: glucokinase [bacterium]
MLVLSGDIGGTHTRLRLADTIVRYNNSDYSSFLDIVNNFFTKVKVKHGEVASACFGIAGPIIDNKVSLTNLSWLIDANDIGRAFKIDKVELINDFMAIGYGISVLKPEDLLTLQIGKPCKDGIRAYIGAGTGLGVGFMTYHQAACLLHPTEGGHIDFAPADDTQLALLKYLRKKYHRVSFERVLSGAGLANIYYFVRDSKIFGEEENPELYLLIKSDSNVDMAAIVAEYAIKHKDIMAMRALDIFMRIYGAAVGNLALTTLPFGGLYVVGGIALKLLTQIKRDGFLEAFADKGRVSALLNDIPLHIVLNEDIGLQGATVRATSCALRRPKPEQLAS